MTYMLIDRADGQVEIVLQKPILVGVMADRELAGRFVAFLQSEEPDLVSEEPARFATAAADVADAEQEDAEVPPDDSELHLRALVEASRQMRTPVSPPTRAFRNVPTVVREVPRAPAILTPAQPKLSEDEIDAAFRRIGSGERLTVVAHDIGVTMGHLRGLWAQHKRALQRHMAEGGQQACSMCQRQFTPSVSHPDTCARCSHG